MNSINLFQYTKKFSIALLSKQGWRLLKYPNSLLAQVLKAKYYPSSDFLHARLGLLPSYTWRSIWAAKATLSKGLSRRIGTGEKVSILDDIWILKPINDKIREVNLIGNVSKVSDLIEPEVRQWRIDLIRRIFPMNIASTIELIPLAKTAHEDILVWWGEPSGVFSVRSAYKLLQNNPSYYSLQIDLRHFYIKMWDLHLFTKIKIAVWRFSWNYFPNLVNLKNKKVIHEAICPRCHGGEEMP